MAETIDNCEIHDETTGVLIRSLLVSESQPRVLIESQPRVLIVSPVRNEARHIARVARAVAGQELRPARWIVIDDGSTDETLQLLRELEREIPFLTVLQAPVNDAAAGVRDRLAQAVEIRNFNFALAEMDLSEYTHVMKLDGDIELPSQYLRVLFERFARDPRLGLAGGVLVEPKQGGEMRRITIPDYHVHGALKCYSRACWEAIGGARECLGWDTIDETYARMRGFEHAQLSGSGLGASPAGGERGRRAARTCAPRRVCVHRAL